MGGSIAPPFFMPKAWAGNGRHILSTIFIGKDTDGSAQELLLNRANRHGLIAGATGTGKTVTLQILTEGFSKAGVPVFAADVKGDLSGLSQAGSADHKLHDKLLARAEKIGLTDYSYSDMPVTFWDLFGEKGHPVRTTIAEMGPMLLSRLMDLSDAQEGVMNIAFDIAEDHKWPLLDMKDLRATLVYVSENRKELSLQYGNITPQSVGAIIRNLLVLEREGADDFFGEPALELKDLIRNKDKQGMVNILAADTLVNSPRLYATFLLWLMSELFEELPEVGDPDKPVMAFFFDEAHLLFDDAPKALVQKITQVSRLIRSKGVSLWFVTQNPADIPDDVLGQIGNHIQHALRGYTPKEQKAIKASAGSFRPNPNFVTEKVIAALGVGEALVSVLDNKGIPQIVGQTLIRPPASRLGPATADERDDVLAASDMGGKYDEMVDRKSAEEILNAKREAMIEAQQKEASKAVSKKSSSKGKSSSKSKKSAGDYVAREAKLMARMMMRRQGIKILRGVLGSVMRR